MNQENNGFTQTHENSQSIASTAYKRSYTRLWWSLGVGIAVAIAVAIIFSSIGIGSAILLAAFSFCFATSLFYEESATRNVIFYMGEKSIRFPGLIWEFSFDGFLWLIGMKILFAVVGFLFGLLCSIIGVLVAFLISPFALPFAIYGYVHDVKNGIE